MGIKLDCPTCGKRMTFDLATTSVLCRHCGYTPSTGIDERAEEIRAKGKRPQVALANASAIAPRAASLFYSAHDRLFDNNKAAAIACLQDAIDIQPDFDEAHLWIAKISDDEQVKRDHLSSILAVNPSHGEAMQMMMILNGRLTAEQAQRGLNSDGPTIKRATEAVKTKLQSTRCPKCNGNLTTDEHTGQTVCGFCGTIVPQGGQASANGDLLFAALLERRATPVKWIIGERLLHCNQCGAERATAASTLSTQCPFCGSNQVIEQDALNSFEQPDGVIPFKVTREQAGSLIKEQLRGLTERVKGWFGNHKVASASLNGYYLPFWMFDATAEVTRTRIRTESNTGKYGYMRNMAPSDVYTQTKFSELFSDIEVCAAVSPPKDLTRQLGDYHTADMLAYSPTLLATYPAQLYTQDFDQAALEARSLISAAMRYKHGQRDAGETEKVTINVFSNIVQMNFRLVLAPVWIAHMVEEDRDHRTALVNGQTGQVVLGKSEKPTVKYPL